MCERERERERERDAESVRQVIKQLLGLKNVSARWVPFMQFLGVPHLVEEQYGMPSASKLLPVSEVVAHPQLLQVYPQRVEGLDFLVDELSGQLIDLAKHWGGGGGGGGRRERGAAWSSSQVRPGPTDRTTATSAGHEGAR